MRPSFILTGLIVVVVGFVLTITIIGAIIGIPLLLIGILIFFVGLFSSSKKKQVIEVKHSYVEEKKK